MSTVDVEDDLRRIRQLRGLRQRLRASLRDAPDVRRHIQQIVHALRIRQGEGKAQRLRVQQPKARQRRVEDLFLLYMRGIDDGLQPRKMALP